tara:strand:+ start:3850 stop:4248 length:399 start_codon:yes stop_codon:yes gene_type:complete
VVRLKKTADSPEDWKLEVRGRSGRSLILESYIQSGCMLWPNWEHADLFATGGWSALADAGYVRTYWFDAVAAREQDRKDREARKPSMVREDQEQEVQIVNEIMPEYLASLRTEEKLEWIKSRIDDEGYINDT